jgi:hypothetical protein
LKPACLDNLTHFLAKFLKLFENRKMSSRMWKCVKSHRECSDKFFQNLENLPNFRIVLNFSQILKHF